MKKLNSALFTILLIFGSATEIFATEISVYSRGSLCEAVKTEEGNLLLPRHCLPEQNSDHILVKEDDVYDRKKIISISNHNSSEMSLVQVSSLITDKTSLRKKVMIGESVSFSGENCSITSVKSPYFSISCTGQKGNSGRAIYSSNTPVGIYLGTAKQRSIGIGVLLGHKGSQPVGEVYDGYEAHGLKISCCKKIADTGKKIEKAVRDGVEGVVTESGEFLENATTVVVDIGNGAVEVIVRAGESVEDATQRLIKGLEHLSTEAWREFQKLEKNLEYASRELRNLEKQISSLRIDMDKLPDVKADSFRLDKLTKIKVEIPDLTFDGLSDLEWVGFFIHEQLPQLWLIANSEELWEQCGGPCREIDKSLQHWISETNRCFLEEDRKIVNLPAAFIGKDRCHCGPADGPHKCERRRLKNKLKQLRRDHDQKMGRFYQSLSSKIEETKE